MDCCLGRTQGFGLVRQARGAALGLAARQALRIRRAQRRLAALAQRLDVALPMWRGQDLPHIPFYRIHAHTKHLAGSMHTRQGRGHDLQVLCHRQSCFTGHHCQERKTGDTAQNGPLPTSLSCSH